MIPFLLIARSSQGESIRAVDPYGTEVLIDYRAESKSCGFCKHAVSCSIDSFPHSTLALLFPTSPEAMGL